ncbi:MAG: hypothetical protein R2867_16145 [Caldilineaceae bacterium]
MSVFPMCDYRLGFWRCGDGGAPGGLCAGHAGGAGAGQGVAARRLPHQLRRDGEGDEITLYSPFGIFDFALGADMDSLVGNALGGTSNLYANVILEPYPEVFNTCMDPSNPSHSRCWPQVITYETLKPYFNKVRGVMGIEKYLDRGDAQSGITTHDPDIEGSPFYGAEAGVDPRTGRTLRDYRGRTVAERPELPKARFLKDALAHIQQLHDDPKAPAGSLRRRTQTPKRPYNRRGPNCATACIRINLPRAT